MKILVLAILAGIVFMLFSSMRYMMTDKGKSTRSVKALGVRVGISVALFAALITLMLLGYIKPNPNPIFFTVP